MTSERDVARTAFAYGLPTVDMYRILHDYALDPTSIEYKGPLNTVAHNRRLADPTDRSIVNPNVDTLYSYAWLDLGREPIVLTMPPIPADRYMSAELFDLYTYVIGYVSPRTTGRSGGSFVITGPTWTGRAPDHLPVFHSTTELCLVMIRTQLFDDADLPHVHALQDEVAVAGLSEFAGRGSRAHPEFTPVAPVDVRSVPTVKFLRVLDWMLRLMPPLPEDADLRKHLAALDLTQGAEIETGLCKGREDVLARVARVRSSAELFGSREFFDGDYLTKAAGAYLGILGNAAEEYLGVGYRVDADGEPFTGQRCYTITFPADGLPSVEAFWSITVYDSTQHLYANEVDRYVISSRTLGDLAREDGGAITLYVQHARPSDELLENWLPTPAGPFGLTFRTYLPGAAIREGNWVAPPVIPR